MVVAERDKLDGNHGLPALGQPAQFLAQDELARKKRRAEQEQPKVAPRDFGGDALLPRRPDRNQPVAPHFEPIIRGLAKRPRQLIQQRLDQRFVPTRMADEEPHDTRGRFQRFAGTRESAIGHQGALSLQPLDIGGARGRIRRNLLPRRVVVLEPADARLRQVALARVRLEGKPDACLGRGRVYIDAEIGEELQRVRGVLSRKPRLQALGKPRFAVGAQQRQNGLQSLALGRTQLRVDGREQAPEAGLGKDLALRFDWHG